MDDESANVIFEAIEQHTSKNLSSSREYRDAPVVIATGAISLAFVNMNYGGIFKVLWNGCFVPYCFKQVDRMW